MEFSNWSLLEVYGVLLIVGGLTLLRNVLSRAGREKLAKNAYPELRDLLDSTVGWIFLVFVALVLTGFGIFLMKVAPEY